MLEMLMIAGPRLHDPATGLGGPVGAVEVDVDDFTDSSGVSRMAGRAVPTPVLLISTSTRPNRLMAASTIRWACAGLAMSVAMTSGSRPVSQTISAVW